MPKLPERDESGERRPVIAALFEHRSGRIIAVSRVIFAVIFFGAVLFDPSAPDDPSNPVFQILGGYLLLAVILFAVAMRSWWWDHLLAWPMLTVDILALLAAVFLTEGSSNDFTSPFLAIFAFVMLSATIRWNWRVTLGAAIGVTFLYFALGLWVSVADPDFNVVRFGRRVAYLLVLSLILVWFGLQRSEQHINRFHERPKPIPASLPPLEEALAFAIAESGARAGAIAWSDNEEPATELRTQGLSASQQRLGPEALRGDGGIGQRARIFSADRRRSLRASRRGRPVALSAPVTEPLADLLGVGEALAFPVTGGTGSGEIVLTGISGICEDHVAIGTLIGRELEAALDRHARLMLLHESGLARSREALARDLHDSVAQSLAGAAMRVEGLRRSIQAGNDPEAEIGQIKDALRAEQRHIRTMIERLRYSRETERSVDLSASMRRVLEELSVRWAIGIAGPGAGPIMVPVSLDYEIANLLREAVANAVRHGNATEVSVSAELGGEGIVIEITDNGGGFAPGTGPEAPRSIRERIRRHGGDLAVRSGSGGTHLAMDLPLEIAA